MARPNGVIAYEGPSQLDGEPIVLILTCLERPSNNIKTGQMVQAVVLRQSEAPTEAVKHGTDASICVNCRLCSGKPSPSPLRSECSGSSVRERHVVIDVHGLDRKVQGFQKLTTASN